MKTCTGLSIIFSAPSSQKWRSPEETAIGHELRLTPLPTSETPDRPDTTLRQGTAHKLGLARCEALCVPGPLMRQAE